jgi:hypothetical protein
MEKQKRALGLIKQAIAQFKGSPNEIDMQIAYQLELQATALRNRIGDFEANRPKPAATTSEVLGEPAQSGEPVEP